MSTVLNLHKINPIKRQIVNSIIDEIKNDDHVSKVVIFGSSIRNDCRDKSDLDIAVQWSEECFDENWIFKPFTLPIFKMIYRHTNGKADIIPIGYEGELNKAIKEGVVVYEKDNVL
jgi:predicted nucleotidyltransferase